MVAVMKNPRKVSVVARILGCDQQTIKRYDRLWLFAPRSDRAGNRIYDNEDIEVLRAIEALRKPGRPLRDAGGPTPSKPKRKSAPARDSGRTQADRASELASPVSRGRGALT